MARVEVEGGSVRVKYEFDPGNFLDFRTTLSDNPKGGVTSANH